MATSNTSATSQEQIKIRKDVLDCVRRRHLQAIIENNLELATRELQTFAIMACY